MLDLFNPEIEKIMFLCVHTTPPCVQHNNLCNIAYRHFFFFCEEKFVITLVFYYSIQRNKKLKMS